MELPQILSSRIVESLCDYSFGTHGAIMHPSVGLKIEPANLTNDKFLKFCDGWDRSKTMNVFIDNVRLYSRKIEKCMEIDRAVFEVLKGQDLLQLLGTLHDIKFMVYTGYDDVAIDYHIRGKIPANVIRVNAVNALYNTPKVKALPLGVLNGKEDLVAKVAAENIVKTKLLYVNINEGTNEERLGLSDIYRDKSWATVDEPNLPYEKYLRRVAQHKFVLCPRGNGEDTHRFWEAVVLGCVPIIDSMYMLNFNYETVTATDMRTISETTLTSIVKTPAGKQG